ncbi:MAG: carboxylesterase family protein [Acidobacteria bacterium]|nr:MAG: carboxylesterase family protein [Acidobacteriota bacterium]
MVEETEERAKSRELVALSRYLILSLSLFFFAGSVFGIDPVVRTESGLVRGSGTGVVAFKGIPYAAPPLGPLRWKAPQAALRWQGTRDAIEYCAGCPQPPFPGVPPTQSEDCLGLNIWTPAKTAKDKLPVMVWIHGGGFMVGSSAQPTYDGDILARQGVVVVSFNYRLGVLGFLAHPELSRESAEKVSGNYGLLDQIAALKWVQRNIAGFGGDPKKVTIFGESAGGVSVFSLLVSPLAKGLFSRAIAQSGTWIFTPIRHLRASWYGYQSAEEEGAALGDLARLRGLSLQDLMKLPRPKADSLFDLNQPCYRPVVDECVLPGDPSELFERGEFARVPLLTGTNADEAALFMILFGRVRTTTDYRAWLSERFGDRAADKLCAAFPVEKDPDVADAVKRLVTDFVFLEPTRSVALSMQSKAPVYFYHFSRVSPGGKTSKLGAHHAAELVYAFGTYKAPIMPVSPQAYDEVDMALGKVIMGAWVQFAKTGNPNGAGLAEWPRYTSGDERCLEFGDTIRATKLPGASRIQMMQAIFEELRAVREKAQLGLNREIRRLGQRP